MSDSSMIVKLVAFISLIAVFQISIGGTQVSGFSDFQSDLATNPMDSIPSFPAVPDFTAGESIRIDWDWLWNGAGSSCPAGTNYQFVQVLPPLTPATSMNVTAGITWSKSIGAHESRDITLYARVQIPFAGGSGTGADFTMTVYRYPIAGGCGSPITIGTGTVSLTTGTYQISIPGDADTTTWTEGDTLRLTLIRTAGNQGILVFIDGTDGGTYLERQVVLANVAPDCDAVMLCINVAAYWIGLFTGSIVAIFIFFANALVWVIVTLASLLVWVATLTVSLFGGMGTMMIYLVAGGGMPAPVSYLFTVIFLSALAFLFFIVVKTIRGGG